MKFERFFSQRIHLKDRGFDFSFFFLEQNSLKTNHSFVDNIMYIYIYIYVYSSMMYLIDHIL